MKKKLVFVMGIALAMALLIGIGGAGLVLAQGSEPPVESDDGVTFGGRGFGQHGGFDSDEMSANHSRGRMFEGDADTGMFAGRGGRNGGFGGGGSFNHDVIAEVLGMTSEDLLAELEAGKTFAEIAEAQGITVEEIQAAMQEHRSVAMAEYVEQALEDGDMTEEQAEWLREGLENDYYPRGRGRSMGDHDCMFSDDE